MKLYIMNSPVITNWGEFIFLPITVEEAREIIRDVGYFESAIGHESTAQFMSAILGVEIPLNRQKVKMQPGDLAIVFMLTQRLPEAKILTLEELKDYSFELGLIEMTASQEEVEEDVYEEEELE